MWVLRKRRLWRLLAHAPFSLPFGIVQAIRSFQRADVVYINTVTVIDYLLAAKFFPSKAIIHVHEAPEGVVGAGFRTLVRNIGALTIFNSESTRNAYGLAIGARSYVLYNGVQAPLSISPCSYDGSRPLRLLMIGRLSRGKAQDLLIEACRRLPPAVLRGLEVRIVGSSFGARRRFEAGLMAKARKVATPEVIRFEPFVAYPAPLYDWCDLVVVPSRVREGLGRVAVEAMAHARAVIAAAHGGLTEVVKHDETGWLFMSGEPSALANAIELAAACPHRVREFGAAGRKRFEAQFAAPLIDARFSEILRQQYVSARPVRRPCNVL
jgi:glycosyltransferase involved in cell wall biosynthesis